MFIFICVEYMTSHHQECSFNIHGGPSNGYYTSGESAGYETGPEEVRHAMEPMNKNYIPNMLHLVRAQSANVTRVLSQHLVLKRRHFSLFLASIHGGDYSLLPCSAPAMYSKTFVTWNFV